MFKSMAFGTKQTFQSTLVLVLLFQSTCVWGQTDINIKKCPSICACDSEERYVICTEKHIIHVPPHLPAGTKLLGLSKNEFTSLSPNTFRSTDINETLQSLVLYDNRIKTIQPLTFQHLMNLKNLWLFGNQLTTLQRNTFAGLGSLGELDLSRNRISSIEDGAFAGMDNLQILHLWGNSLKVLQPDSFDGLQYLTNLTLGDNLFEEVPSEAFHNLQNLSSLEILNLPVTVLRPNAFASLYNLNKLHIGDWPLLRLINDNTFANLPVLTYVSLYRCNLKDIPRVALSLVPTLKHLLLSNNPQIKRLSKDDFHSLHNLEDLYLSNIGVHTLHESPFEMLTKLKNLDLSQNKISILPGHIFLQLENLQALNLSYNQISELSNAAFIPLTRINVVDLSNNDLICDCDIKWLKSLQERKIREQFTLKGKCSDPTKYNGTDIVKLPPRKFICEPPLFDKENKNITVVAKVGSSVMLPCSLDHGVPTPTATWILPHIFMTMQPTTLHNGSLLIKKVKQQDYGEYRCETKNKYGNDNGTVMLAKFIQPAPVTPSQKQSSGATTGVLVTLAVVVVLAVLVFFLYKRYRHSTYRNGLYDAMLGNDEGQRLSMKNGPKLN